MAVDGIEQRLLQRRPVQDAIGSTPALAREIAAGTEAIGRSDVPETSRIACGSSQTLSKSRRARRASSRMRDALGESCRPAPTSVSTLRLFEDLGADALARKRQSSRQAGNAGADDGGMFDRHLHVRSGASDDSGRLDMEDAAGRFVWSALSAAL